MSNEDFKKLTLNQRVSMFCVEIVGETKIHFRTKTIYGYVTKIYNGNHQCQVWFDKESKPRVVGKKIIELVIPTN